MSQRVAASSAFHLRGLLNVGLFVGWFDLGVHVRTATQSTWLLIRRAMDSVREQGALPVRGVARGVNGDQGDRLRLVSWGSAHRVPIVSSLAPLCARRLVHHFAGLSPWVLPLQKSVTFRPRLIPRRRNRIPHTEIREHSISLFNVPSGLDSP